MSRVTLNGRDLVDFVEARGAHEAVQEFMLAGHGPRQSQAEVENADEHVG